MDEKKQKQKQILTWIAVVAVLWVLLLILVGKYNTASKKEAISKAEDTLIRDVYVWSAQVNAIMETGRLAGELLKEDGLSTAENIKVAKKMTDSSFVSHIYQVKDDCAYINEDGRFASTKISVSIPGAGYLFVDNFSVGDDSPKTDALLVVVPVGNSDEYLLIQIDESYIETVSFEDSHRELSFLSVADKLGNVCITFDTFRDRTSSFLLNSNILDNVSELDNSLEYAGNFKTCYISGVKTAIIAESRNEKRVLAFSPIGDTGYSLVYGVRYSYAESLIDSYYANSKDTIVKIMLVVFAFSAFVVGVILLTSLRYKERDRELENKADTDLLTELNNKLATERKIQEYMSTKPDGRGVMFILDIDNFKKINDTMGHAFGDTLLRTLGKEIKAEFRASDVIGRTGGDEFIVFLKDINDDAIIERESNRLLKFFQDFKAGDDYVKYSATASIGAAIFPDNADNFKDLYVAADKALYKAKKRGKNQLCFFEEK